ncbi:hypothetical protein MKW92_039609 [Papaver armeniacum]|nr:hypothetical protein MKW92_039609 [Papaver armeniacum]
MAITRTGGGVHIVDGVTSVDCHNRVRSWSLLRSVLWFIIPRDYYYNNKAYLHYLQPSRSPSVSPPIITKTNTNTVISITRINNVSTDTIYGYRHGKVNLCIQSNPITLIGLLRIALECNSESRHSSSPRLMSVPVWTMYCNGRKVGSATKRVPTQADKKVLSLMRNVDEGVGIINGKTATNITIKCGSAKSESFHLINKDGSNSQQLSIFFIRTR